MEEGKRGCKKRPAGKGTWPDQQVIGRQVKTNAEFFQGQDRWGGFAPGNIAKVSGTEIAPLGGSFIAELAGYRII